MDAPVTETTRGRAVSPILFGLGIIWCAIALACIVFFVPLVDIMMGELAHPHTEPRSPAGPASMLILCIVLFGFCGGYAATSRTIISLDSAETRAWWGLWRRRLRWSDVVRSRPVQRRGKNMFGTLTLRLETASGRTRAFSGDATVFKDAFAAVAARLRRPSKWEVRDVSDDMDRRVKRQSIFLIGALFAALLVPLVLGLVHPDFDAWLDKYDDWLLGGLGFWIAGLLGSLIFCAMFARCPDCRRRCRLQHCAPQDDKWVGEFPCPQCRVFWRYVHDPKRGRT